jgi:tetratricopeptide (TPR) repeat protein
MIEQNMGNFLSAQKYLEIAHSFDEDYNWCMFQLLGNSIVLRNYEIAKKYVDEIEKRYDVLPYNFFSELFLGIAYLKNGKEEKAKKHLEEVQKKLIKTIQFNLPEAQVHYSYLNLANVYSLNNEKEKALTNLKEVLKRESITQFVVILLNKSPFFDNIRDEPEFQEILTQATSKYQNEHERVGELLREFGEIE